ncbi:MAG: 16S rRNA (adenine(1518)-N(6)/adenine(1519)-N(6))-dimethyltransferase RsmA [Candidatus Bathyarchaeia archaeon]
MSLEETKQLLRNHRIVPNKLLGQHFMVEPVIYSKLCTYCHLDFSDVVLDAGAGFGFLSCFLADKCKAVIAVEKDPKVAAVLHVQLKDFDNVTVVEGDVLKTELPQFNKVIAIPPYCISTHLVTWLVERKLDCAIIIIQKEFAEKLVASAGNEDYGWLTVQTYLHSEAQLLDSIPKEMFFPEPKVDSVIVRLKPWIKSPFEVRDEVFFKKVTKWLFTQRNKKLCKAIVPFLKTNLNLSKQEAGKIAAALPFQDKRPRELTPECFGELVNAIPR